MSTKKAAVGDTAEGWESPFEPEHLSLVPLVGAVGAIASGVENGWTVAALLLALAYLFVYVRSRRRSGE